MSHIQVHMGEFQMKLYLSDQDSKIEATLNEEATRKYYDKLTENRQF